MYFTTGILTTFIYRLMTKLNPAYTPEQELLSSLENFRKFVQVVYQLRKECPWDAEQTHDSIKMMTLEEAYEAVDSINSRNFDELKSELGDLLLHITLHAVIAEEEKNFSLSNVIEEITDKLIRRHPHIFADVNVSGAGEVEKNWEQLKLLEGRDSVFDGIPKALPALQKSVKIRSKAAKNALTLNTEEHADLKGNLSTLAAGLNSAEKKKKFFGELLLAISEVSDENGVNPEEALSSVLTDKEQKLRTLEAELKSDKKD